MKLPAIASAALFLVASARPVPAEDGTLRLGGSTTLLPAVSSAAAEFMEKHETWDKADPSLPARRVVIFVTGGGSSFGIKSVLDGVVDVALVSRDLKEEEKKQLGEHEVYLLAKDCLAVAVNRRSPLAAQPGFTTEELARIFSGEAKTYRQVNAALPDQPFALLVRDASGGAAEIFKDKVLGKRAVALGALQLPSQGALLKKLESNRNAIGYISSGLASQSDALKTFAVDGVEPSGANIVAGRYSLARPLLMVVKGKPSPHVRRFVDYMLDEGQRHVAGQGFVPVTAGGTASR